MKLLRELIEDLHLPRPPFWMVSVLIISVVMNGARGLPAVGNEGRLMRFMWAYMAIAFATLL